VQSTAAPPASKLAARESGKMPTRQVTHERRPWPLRADVVGQLAPDAQHRPVRHQIGLAQRG